MKSIFSLLLLVSLLQGVSGQDIVSEADKLKSEGLLMPALMKYGEQMMQQPTSELAYDIATTTALLWTSQMRDTSFYFLNFALQDDNSLEALYDPEFLSLIDDERWESIEDMQLAKYESIHGPIKNKAYAKELFKMIIKDQGFMYQGNIERSKYIQNGGYFGTSAIFPLLAKEEEYRAENEAKLFELLDKYGWPKTSDVTEFAAAGAALVINHSSFELRTKYFPMLEKAFKEGEAQPLRYAKMKDRLLVENKEEQLYGTQIKFESLQREPYPIKDEHLVDQRRKEIGLGPLSPYLKARFDIDWNVDQQ